MTQDVIDLTFDERANGFLSRIGRAEAQLRATVERRPNLDKTGTVGVDVKYAGDGGDYKVTDSRNAKARQDLRSPRGDAVRKHLHSQDGESVSVEETIDMYHMDTALIDPTLKRTKSGKEVQGAVLMMGTTDNATEKVRPKSREIEAPLESWRSPSTSIDKPCNFQHLARPLSNRFSSISPFPHERIPESSASRKLLQTNSRKPTKQGSFVHDMLPEPVFQSRAVGKALQASSLDSPYLPSCHADEPGSEMAEQPSIPVQSPSSPRLSIRMAQTFESIDSLPAPDIKLPVSPELDRSVMEQVSNQDTFPPNLDRGRFPKERRRRGGLKSGARRLNDLTRTPMQGPLKERTEQCGPPHAQSTVSSNTLRQLFPDLSAPFDRKFYDTGDERADVLMWKAREESEIAALFNSLIAPVLKKSSEHFQKALSPDEQVKVANQLADATVCDDLVRNLRRINFQTTKRQRKRMKKSLRIVYTSALTNVVDSRHKNDWRRSVSQVQIPWTWIFSTNSVQNVSEEVSIVGETPGNLYSEKGIAHAASSIAHKINQDVKLLPTVPKAASNAVQREQSCDRSYTTFTVQPDENLPAGRRRVVRASKLEALRNIKAFNPYCREVYEQQQAKPDVELVQISPKLGDRYRTLHDALMERSQAAAALGDVHPVNPLQDRESEAAIWPREQQELLQSDKFVRGILARQNGGKILRLVETGIVDPIQRTATRPSTVIRRRELGPGVRRVQRSDLHSKILELPRPWRRWKGASSDIVGVAWAPDCTTFAVGAAAHTNTEDLQYNRPCNLMLGDLVGNKLIELPEHRTHRPKPDAIAGGPNSIQETYNTCDPLVYQTVNGLAFAADGKRLYTASRDRTLKAWNACDFRTTSEYTVHHGEIVTNIDVCTTMPDRLATACQSVDTPIRIIIDHGDHASIARGFSSSRAQSRPSCKILPECIRWGPPAVAQYLLAGFTQWENLGQDELARQGHLCLWDVEYGTELKVSPNAQSVSSIAWHPTLCGFVTGGAPAHQLRSQSIKSCVRTYDCRQATSLVCEFESTALEIQDVTFSPQDSRIVTAGCTDGTVYVWDSRQPNLPIHTLRHGKPLMELDAGRPRGECDTGVRLNLWGAGASLFYSGSSDGVVKAWDFRRHPEDVLKYNVAQIGAAIQDGAFSPDYTNLLVGDADGGIHMLSSAPCGPQTMDERDEDALLEQEMRLIRAYNGSGEILNHDSGVGESEGIQAANVLIETGEIEMHPLFGPGQGVNYKRPHASDDQQLTQDSIHKADISRQQVRSATGGSLNDDIVAQRLAFQAMRRNLLGPDLDHSRRRYASATSAHPHSPPVESRLSEIPVVESHRRYTLNLHEALFRKETPFEVCTAALSDLDVGNQTCSEGTCDDIIPEERMIEESFWWPDLGRDEIQKALKSY